MDPQDIDLPYLPMEDAAFAADPYPYLAAAREKHPWLARGAFGYVVFGHKAMRDLLRRDGPLESSYAQLVAPMGARGTPWGDWTERHLLAIQAERHHRIRAVLAPKFTPRQANNQRELMRSVIAGLLDEWAPKGEFDFELFASHFPITVMSTLIGGSPEDVPSLRGSLEALGLSAAMLPEHLPALQKAFLQMDGFVQDLVARRRQGGRARAEADMLDELLEAVDGGGMSERELYDLLVFLFVAGFDSSKNVMTLIMNVLLEHPEKYARCGEDPAYCREVIEETLRYWNPSTIPRITVEDVDYAGITIPKGTNLFFPVSLAGRDPAAVPEPERFEPESEKRNLHLAFGMGIHICLGQFMARALIQEAFHQIPQRIKSPRRAGTSGWRPFFGVWGMRGLPIEFTPG